MAEHKVDLDSECIWLDERWYKKDELVGVIKTKLETGAFNAVTGYSQALEQLDYAIRSARVLAFRVPMEICDALTSHAQQNGLPVGALLRHAVAQLLLQAHASAATAPQSAVPVAASPPSPPLPSVIVSGDVEHVNEPVTPEEQAAAVPLRPKTLPAGAQANADAEGKWFRDREESGRRSN